MSYGARDEIGFVYMNEIKTVKAFPGLFGKSVFTPQFQPPKNSPQVWMEDVFIATSVLQTEDGLEAKKRLRY